MSAGCGNLAWWTRRLVLAAACMSATGVGAAYPVKPVRLVVPYAAGGGTDTLARLVAQKLSDSMAQSVVVDNRPAVDGIIGSDIVAKSTPDGYTLLVISSSHAINPALGRKLPFDVIKDFSPITHTANQQIVLVVHPKAGVSTVRELIDVAKSKPDSLNYGSSSNATALPMELFKTMAGIRIVHIPYKGSGPMLNDLVGGQILSSFSGAISAVPHVRSGRLRALAIGDDKRSTFLADVPTLAEAGVPGFQATIWSGVFGPAGLPRPIVDRLNKEIIAAMHSADVKQRLTSMGADPVGSTPAAWGEFIRNEIGKWRKVAQLAGLKTE